MILDHHPADSRTDIADDQNTIQTLTSRMGTGGGNVPMILEPIPPEGNGARPSHHGDGYRKSGPMYSLNTTEVHAVAYAVDMGGGKALNSDSRNYVVIPIAVLGGGREHSTICMDETAPTLCTFQDSKPILIARIDNAEIL